MAIQAKHISLSVSDGTVMQAYTAVPDKGDKASGIIIFQEAFGVNNHIRNLVERFAGEGYVAIAPELFHRTAPAGFETGYSDFSLVAPHYTAVTEETIEADATAAFDWLQQHKQVEKDKIACTGYCLGGRASFIANSVLPLKAAVVYYGGGIAAILKRSYTQHAPVLFCWGGLDKHITHDQVEAIVTEMDRAGKPYVNTVFSYADHAFSNNDRPNYQPQAANEAWALTLAFLKEKLN